MQALKNTSRYGKVLTYNNKFTELHGKLKTESQQMVKIKISINEQNEKQLAYWLGIFFITFFI